MSSEYDSTDKQLEEARAKTLAWFAWKKEEMEHDLLRLEIDNRKLKEQNALYRKMLHID